MTVLGIALLSLGAIAVLAESHVPALGLIGGPGVLTLGAGAILAVAGLGGGILLAILVALTAVAGAALLLGISLGKGLAVRRRRVRSGPERLLGHVAVVRSWNGRGGTVLLDGALWRARQGYGDEWVTLHPGDAVVVEGLDGLTLAVRRAEEWELV